MRPGEWTHAYEEAWAQFYGIENMKKILGSVRPKKYWDIFLNFVWYKHAIQVERIHPIVLYSIILIFIVGMVYEITSFI